MITYTYWLGICLLAGFMLYSIGFQARKWRGAAGSAAVVLLVGWGAYFFYFENLFVKRLGGVMTVTTPEGHHHLGTTWKEDNLWVETYDPQKNECTFSEYSRGNLLQGRVVIKDCNPLLR